MMLNRIWKQKGEEEIQREGTLDKGLNGMSLCRTPFATVLQSYQDVFDRLCAVNRVLPRKSCLT